MSALAAAHTAGAPAVRGQPSVLVVDDNDANLLAFQAILEPLGQPVVTAGSGEQALRLLLQREFAVIVLDVQMPSMSGFELATLIKSHARLRGVPIIFVTALSREASNVFTGYAHGAVDYLVKPLEPELLRAKVSVFVDLYRAQETIRLQAERLHAQEVREIARRNEERFIGLTDSMPLPVWGVEPGGVVYVCNRAWTEYSGLTAEQTDPMAGPSWMHGSDAEGAAARWVEARRAGLPYDVECRLRRRDGAFRWHLMRAVPERGGRERQDFWIVTATDIDAQKTVEDERARMLERERRAREEAEAANRVKDEFLATVSHELRTPLNAILGWSHLMRTGALPAGELPRAIETIERNARAQVKLISDLLDVSRIVSGKLSLQIGLVDLYVVVKHAIDGARPVAEAKSIDLVWEPATDGTAMAIGDPARLEQIVWNLVSNAVKFTSRGGRVRVRLEPTAEGTSVVVEDNGRGIAPGFLPHVFDRFRQEDATAAREHEGLGLGLSIVKHLVALHGGRVLAESEGLGQGARFTVLLPEGGPGLWGDGGGTDSARPDAEPGSTAAERGAALFDRRLDVTKVLVVDDQPESRELVSLVLGRHGATVVAVESADQAIGVFKSSPPHVLISDIGLPGEDGYALMRRVRSLPPASGGAVPAIALTAYVHPDDRRRAADAGFQLHMAKPVDPDELVAAVMSLSPTPAERTDTAPGMDAGR